MSLMLANRYFYAGRFADAAKHLERFLEKNPRHLGAARKLMVSLASTGRVQEALCLADQFMRDSAEDLLDLPDNEDPGEYQSALLSFRDHMNALPFGEYHAGLAVLQIFLNPSESLSELDRVLKQGEPFKHVGELRTLLFKYMEAGYV